VTIVDVNDARVTGARVLLTSNEQELELWSDEEGKVSLELPAGRYEIEVTANGFARYRHAGMPIQKNAVTYVPVRLKVTVTCGPEVEEPIVRTYDDPPTDVADPWPTGIGSKGAAELSHAPEPAQLSSSDSGTAVAPAR
jgi:hypothetical protein